MIRHWLLACLLFMVWTGDTSRAQSVCPVGVASDKLICLIPQVYGVNGLVLSASAPGQFDFASSTLKAVNSSIVSQATTLPMTSPSSGLTFTFDPAAKIFAPSTASLGPVVGERADTIGKSKVFLAFDYQYFNFTSFDGLSLKNLPVVFTQQEANTTVVPGSTCSLNGRSTAECAFIRDVVTTNNRLDLKVQQFITIITYGVTNQIDASLTIPIENIRTSISSNVNIVNNSNSPIHFFDNRTDCGTATTNCLNQQFSSAGQASGIGDMTLRIKATVWKGEQAALALGAVIRVPTGDSLNFLGVGAAGFEPFFAWSRAARISPHALVGYQTNGSSVLAGDATTGAKDRLPSQVNYSGGFDARVTKRLTAAVDLIGREIFQVQRLSRTTFTEPAACMLQPPFPNCAPPFQTPNTDPALAQSTGSVNLSDLSVGGKFLPLSNLVFTGNVLVKLNDGGLRSTVVPLVGISYTF
jgi:hypothetical protein